MILPDVNLLLYAYNTGAPHHEAARTWWEGALAGTAGVGLPWAVALGFVRLATHPRVVLPPMPPTVAFEHVRSWLAQPRCRWIVPGPRHIALVEEMVLAAGAAGSLTTDAHLAALAIEHGCELHSNDADFARFPGLRWRNPLLRSA